jgi:radical SAM superfamily enzyme YgiQ (UPF0313 family)
MGGPHPTAVYERLIPEHADVVVLGEGDDTIVDVVSHRDLRRIEGVAYWDGALRVNPRRHHILDLDRLGFPAWRHYRFEAYRDGVARRPYAIITTSRGCPYRCTYCTKNIHGHEVRTRSLDVVIAEIDCLVRDFGIREIQLGDDALSCLPDRVKQLCRMIIARRYPDLRFSLPNGMRPDHADEEMFRLLAEAGVYSVTFGFESGAPRVLDATGKALSLDGAEQTVRMARASGLLVRGCFMIGLPGDTPDTIQATIDLACHLPLDNAAFSIFIPFPGTESHAEAERRGQLLVDLALTSATPLGGAVYETPALRAETTNRLYRRAYRQFFLRPRMVGRLIAQGLRSPPELWGLVKYGVNILLRGGAYG